MPLDGTLLRRETLVPRSATPYMRAMSAAMALPDDLIAAIDRAGAIKRELPDAAIPFLLWEYGLEPVSVWVPDKRRVLREGRAWQRIRGTPESVRRALSWVDAPWVRYEDDPADDWWDLFQLELAGVDNDRHRLAAFVALTRLSKSAHTDVIRIYNSEGDDRCLEINGYGEINGAGLINDWSGEWVRPDWPKVALAETWTDRAALDLSRLAVHDAIDDVLAFAPTPVVRPAALPPTIDEDITEYAERECGWSDGPWREQAMGLHGIEIMDDFATYTPPLDDVVDVYAAGWRNVPWSNGPYRPVPLEARSEFLTA